MDTTSNKGNKKQLPDFLIGKSEHTLILFDHFINEYQKIGAVTIHPAKTMIGIANSHKRIVYVTQLGRNFIHVVFPFKKRYDDNLCFQKIVYMPQMFSAFTHHLRVCSKGDVNDEVLKFMKIAYNEEF